MVDLGNNLGFGFQIFFLKFNYPFKQKSISDIDSISFFNKFYNFISKSINTFNVLFKDSYINISSNQRNFNIVMTERTRNFLYSFCHIIHHVFNVNFLYPLNRLFFFHNTNNLLQIGNKVNG